MNQEVLGKILAHFVREERQRTHSDNVAVVLVRSDEDFEHMSDDEASVRFADKLEEINDAVNARFRITAKDIMNKKVADMSSRILIPDDFQVYYNGVRGADVLAERCRNNWDIDSTLVLPYVSHESFRNLNNVWIQTALQDTSSYYVVCVRWAARVPTESLSTVIHLDSYVRDAMLNHY